MENPQNKTIVMLDKVKQEINTKSYTELVNHPYISNQLKIFFGESNSEKVINTFKSNYLVLLTDANVIKTIEKADKFTVIQSLLNLTKDNLSINPSDKESCIVTYNGKAVAIPMWRGKLKRMQEQGVIQYLDYLECVYESDKFSNNMGKFNHSINYKRKANEKIIGVLLVALMPDGRSRSKFVLSKDIEKRKAKSKMPNIWKEWEDEMYKKTAITIFEGEIGKRSLHYSEEYEIEDDNTIIQDSPTIEEYEEASYTVEEDAIEQDAILVSSLNELIENNPNVFKDGEIDKLKSNLNSYSDEKLTEIIKSINGRIEKINKASLENEQKNEPPI